MFLSSVWRPVPCRRLLRFNKSEWLRAAIRLSSLRIRLFATINDTGSQWQYRQHAGDQSFTVDSEEGTITFKRIGSEPWALFIKLLPMSASPAPLFVIPLIYGAMFRQM